MRLDGVEVKVSVEADQTQGVVQALNLLDVPPWQIFFIEDVTTGHTSATPLLDAGLIIRARQKLGAADDVTVKLRPGRRSQLDAEWFSMTKTKDGDLKAELKVEEDWAGERRSLAISLTAERPNGCGFCRGHRRWGVCAVDAGPASADRAVCWGLGEP